MGSESVLQALATLRGISIDAVVMLGTGMPSLKSILQIPSVDGAPVISCTLALAWRCARAEDGAACSAESLREWMAGTDWKAHWQARCQSTGASRNP